MEKEEREKETDDHALYDLFMSHVGDWSRKKCEQYESDAFCSE